MVGEIEIIDELIQKAIASGRLYCAFFYRAGPVSDLLPGEYERIQKEHLRYLFSLRAEGTLVISGPVMDDAEIKGVGIFNLNDPEVARELLEGDPAVKAGCLTYQIYPWFGVPGDSLPR